MNTFAVLALCIQACLVQTAFGICNRGLIGPAVAPLGVPACGGPLAAPALGWADIAAPFGAPALGWAEVAAPFGTPALGWAGADRGSYGGTGIGNVAVAGELPVAGTTAVAGQVPIIGAVGFGGEACAGGAVSIAGRCGCGCGSPYAY